VVEEGAGVHVDESIERRRRKKKKRTVDCAEAS